MKLSGEACEGESVGGLLWKNPNLLSLRVNPIILSVARNGGHLLKSFAKFSKTKERLFVAVIFWNVLHLEISLKTVK